MNITFDFFFVFFIILMIYLAVVAPVTGYLGHKKLKRSVGIPNKINEYKHLILWSWLPVFFICLLLPLPDTSLSNLGFRWINLNKSSISNWVVIPFITLCLIYFFYNIYLIVILKIDIKVRAEASKKLPDDIKLFLPVTKQEKNKWVQVALSAGITEEVIYRGYMFFALAYFFPSISIVYILLISTVLFGVGHIYQGKEVIKPVILGLLFGFAYIVFDSIIPVMVLHATQDLVVTDLLTDEKHDVECVS